MEFDFLPAWQTPPFFGAVLAVPPTAIGIIAVCLAYYSAGMVSTRGLIEFSLFVVVAAVPLSLLYVGYILPTSAIAEPVQLRVRGRTSNASYPWSSIEELMLATFSDAARRTTRMARILGLDPTRACVRVRLRKAPRLSFIPRRFGTNVSVGIPLPIRTIYLYPRDAQGFMDYCTARPSAFE